MLMLVRQMLETPGTVAGQHKMTALYHARCKRAMASGCELLRMLIGHGAWCLACHPTACPVPVTVPGPCRQASLLLGNIVPPQHMEMLEMKAALQETIDDALEELTSFLELKKKLDATAQDMLALGVPIEDLVSQTGDVAKSIQTAATNYARVSSDLLPKIARAHAMKGRGAASLLESPMDYSLSSLKTDLPLGSDSLEMDARQLRHHFRPFPTQFQAR